MRQRMKTVTRHSLVLLTLGVGANQYFCDVAFGQAQGNQAAGTPSVNAAAEQAYQTGDYARTINLTTTTLNSTPEDHVALYLRGSARVEQGIVDRDIEEIRKGVGDAREAIRLGGVNNSIYYLPYLYGMTNLTLVEGRKEHAEISVRTANQALSLEGLKPDQKARLLYQRGLANNALEKPEEAATDFEEAIKSDSTLLAAYTVAASTLASSNKMPQAKAMFDRAVKAFPENPLVYNNRGDFLRQTNEVQAAIADYTRALELNPNYFYAATNRVFALLQNDDAAAAEADFTNSLRIEPNQPMVYGLRGTARVAQKRFDEALADHKKAVELVPNSPVAMTDLAFAQFFSGQFQEAAQSFEKAQTLNPNFRQLHPWRIAALEKIGRKDAALGEFQAIFDKPEDQRDWVEQLIAFQYDKINAEQLRAKVAAEEPLHSAQLAEAEYFIGAKALAAQNAAAAKQAFQTAVNTGAKHLSAYRGAKFALEQL